MVSVLGKGRVETYQVRIVESNVNEPLMTCRKDIDESQNQGRGIILGQGWRLPAYWPTGLRHIDGENAIRALIWNMGTCRDNVKGACQAGSTRKTLSTMYSTGADQTVVVKKFL